MSLARDKNLQVLRNLKANRFKILGYGKKTNRFNLLCGNKTNCFNLSFGREDSNCYILKSCIIWLEVNYLSLYKGVRKSFLLKALNIYWILSKSILGDRNRSFSCLTKPLYIMVFISFP